MPLLEIVGVTSTNTTFCIAFVFMDEEKEANYTWALNCLKSALDGYDGPYVIVTDRELALMNACAKAYFKKAWENLLESSTKTAYLQNYAHLESILVDYPAVLDYLNRTWLAKYKEMFVSLWTNSVLHFHNHTNNRVESQHSKLKKYLDSNHSKLDRFFEHIEDNVQSQLTIIKANIEKSKIVIKHRHNTHHFKNLLGFVSLHALDKIRQELDRLDAKKITEDDCGCQLRHSCGLPCAHEIAFYSSTGQAITLGSIEKFWRKLDLNSVFKPGTTEDDELRCDDDVELFKESFAKQSTDGKVSYLRKLKGIFAPSSTTFADPVVRKNTRGRPRGSTKQPQAKPPVPPVQNPPPQDPRRRSFSTYTPEYMGANSFNLNQEPERHNTYSFREPSMFNFFNQDQSSQGSYYNQDELAHNSYFHQEQPMQYSIPLMNEIPHEFHPYVTHIENVRGDGNCGFRAIAASLGYGQDSWRQIRSDLYDELYEHREQYTSIYYDYFNNISHSLNYFGSDPALLEHWLIMVDCSFLIANKYNAIVHFLSERGSSTCFPLRIGPQDIPNHLIITIALIHTNHYVKVDLQGGCPMPSLLPLWRHRRSQRAAGWETMYRARLDAYIPPNVPRNNSDIPIVNVPSG